MPSFILKVSDTNRAVVGYLRRKGDVTVIPRVDAVRIESDYAITLDRLVLSSKFPSLSENDWARLYREISRTVQKGRVWPPRRKFDRAETWIIKVLPLKTRRVQLVFDPIDYNIAKEAAALAKKSLSDFIRSAVMKFADEIFDKETMRRQQERQQQQATVEATKPQPYVG